MVEAVRTALTFDTKAGLRNNLIHFVAISNRADTRAYLRTCELNGARIRVALEDKLIGTTVTVRRAPSRALQDAWLISGTVCAQRIAPTCVDSELKQFATAAAAVTRMIYGTLWILPSINGIALRAE